MFSFFHKSPPGVPESEEAQWRRLHGEMSARGELGPRPARRPVDPDVGRLLGIVVAGEQELAHYREAGMPPLREQLDVAISALSRANDGAAIAARKIDELYAQIRVLKDEKAVLEAENVNLTAHLAAAALKTLTEKPAPPSGGGDPPSIYSQVGLHRSAPEYIVRIARTAHRKANHPDKQPPHRKEAAEAEFKRIDNIFDQIYAERGMPK